LAKAKEIIDQALHKLPELTIESCVSKETFKNPTDLAHLVEGLRKAGVPE
jgi:hypothetical protein